MRTEMVTVFKINELAKEVQEKVIKRYQNKEDWCWDYSDSDMLTEDFKNNLEGTMFQDCDVHWSLSYSQGDGVKLLGDIDHVTLYNFLVDSGEFNKTELRRIKYILDYICIELVDSSYYSSSYYNIVDYRDYIPCSHSSGYLDYIEPLMNRLIDIVKEESDKLTSQFETIGYESIEYTHTDEYILARLEDNEYEFYEDGRDF